MSFRLAAGLAAMLLGLVCGCGGVAGGSSPPVASVHMEGSDTMVNVAQAWAETYHQRRPDVSVQVLGGGSGVGIASLIDGNCDMANCSRRMKPAEIDKAQAERGQKPIEHIVGYDAMGIYVHPDNPISGIALDELAEIFRDGGTITRWSQLGVEMPPGAPDRIIRVTRQNSSGTYAYFREHVLGKGPDGRVRDMGLGAVEANGSKDAVALVGKTPCAIGYSGMGYATPEVKMVPVSKGKGRPGVAPTVANARNNSYPITRPLLVYTLGQEQGAVKDYLDWIYSAEGQEIVLQLGYVPAREHE